MLELMKEIADMTLHERNETQYQLGRKLESKISYWCKLYFSPYGNSVVMEDENGNTVRYSHLESIGVKRWDTLGFGDIVGNARNTGNVRGKNGEVLTEEQIKAGRGSHVDVEIKDKSGKLLSQSEQVDYLKSKNQQWDLMKMQFLLQMELVIYQI